MNAANLIARNCDYYSGSSALKCAVNPLEPCLSCQHFSGDYKKYLVPGGNLPSERLINKIVQQDVLLNEMLDEPIRGGRYRVKEWLRLTNKGGRNREPGDNSWVIHSFKTGAPYKEDSFSRSYDSEKEAAIAMIRIYGILALDANNRPVRRR